MASACFLGLPAFNSVFKFLTKQFCEAHFLIGILFLRFHWRDIRLGWRLETLVGVALVDLVLSEVAAKLLPLPLKLVPNDVVHLVWNEVPGIVAWKRWHISLREF